MTGIRRVLWSLPVQTVVHHDVELVLDSLARQVSVAWCAGAGTSLGPTSLYRCCTTFCLSSSSPIRPIRPISSFICISLSVCLSSISVPFKRYRPQYHARCLCLPVCLSVQSKSHRTNTVLDLRLSCVCMSHTSSISPIPWRRMHSSAWIINVTVYSRHEVALLNIRFDEV